ncbi:uncharacterized protein L203_102268 [Cryptococcus depauperatus CBS 7841]|uniref:Uncharacterized protein n=1 Tax=Cryptococcus depauperatus CBS 7841 TaxID=1295531 RepID=A0AAJ8M104_9TREE
MHSHICPKEGKKSVNFEKRQLISSFQIQHLSQRDVCDDLFNGLLFYVARGSSEGSKAELEALLSLLTKRIHWKKILSLIKTLLVSISEDNAAGRYYNKPLDEVCSISFIVDSVENGPNLD